MTANLPTDRTHAHKPKVIEVNDAPCPTGGLHRLRNVRGVTR